MKLTLKNSVYDVLKWAALIGLPAAATLYTAISGIWGLPYADEVSKTINALIAFVGVIIGISTAHYNEKGDTL